MFRVFISHSHKDRDFVEREIIAPLRANRIDTWYSTDNIRTATEWEESIREGLRNCDWFLVVLSPNSVGSKWVRREVHWAMERREGHVVPVLIEDCMPEDLHLGLFPIQLVDFRYDKEKAQAKLLAIWGVDQATDKLYEEAQAAFRQEDWETATTKLQALLQARPSHVEAQALLQQARRRQDLTHLYAEGLAHFQARRWRDALAGLERAQELDANYKDVARLVAETREQIDAARISRLFQEADAAAANEVWEVAIKKLEEILSVKPEHAEAQQKLTEARQRQQLAMLYEVGLNLHREGRWADALKTLYVVRSMAADYSDVVALIAEAEDQQQAPPPQPPPRPSYADTKVALADVRAAE